MALSQIHEILSQITRKSRDFRGTVYILPQANEHFTKQKYYAKHWHKDKAVSIGYKGNYIDRYHGTLDSLLIEIVSEYPDKISSEGAKHVMREKKEVVEIQCELDTFKKINERCSIVTGNLQNLNPMPPIFETEKALTKSDNYSSKKSLIPIIKTKPTKRNFNKKEKE